MSDGQIEYLDWDRSLPYPLGRHIRHDPRSRNFAALVSAMEPEPTLDKRHRVYGPKLNQHQVGACTGFTGARAMNSSPQRAVQRPKPVWQNHHALDLYSRATHVDIWEGHWPPEDTGSSGLAVAIVLKDRGLIQSYDHAFGFQHGLGVITYKPLMQGTYWTNSMFNPNPDGRVFPFYGSDVGGHEYLWVGVELRSKLTRADNRSWFINSWGGDWGVKGYFYMTWDDHAALLARDGDLIGLV